MSKPPPALFVSGLSKSYGRFPVLRELTLAVEGGSIHGLVGLNGSGKTTTLECILGLQRFDAGTVRILDHAPEHLHRARGRVVGIFDTPSLNPNLSVRQSLTLARMLCPAPTRTPAQVEGLLGIERFRDFRIRQLSLGNKRRAAIAHALLADPELIILDEPFNGLDAGGVDDVLELIATLNRDQGTSFLLSSHQLPYLEQVCSHIAILHQGRIVTSAAVTTLLEQTESTALLRTPDLGAAKALLANRDDFAVGQVTHDGYLSVMLSDTDSASLNRLLVEKGIPVQELVLQRASLDKLFRDVTREPLS